MSTYITTPTPVGQILAAELDARRWTQADFASVLDRPTQFISEIITGKKEITRESAAQIGAALGQTPEFWLKLQDAYLLSEQARNGNTQQSLDRVRRRARLNELAPINILRKRGVLTGATLDDLEAEVIDLFELGSLEDEPATPHAARRSNDDEPVSPVQKAWVACVRKAARTRINENKLRPFSTKKLTQLAAELPSMLRDPEQFNNLPEALGEVGVVLVYVEALPGARIDGCSFYLNRKPVIGVSGRGKRLDKVLFTLMHEIAHVALGHVTSETIVDSLDDHDTDDVNETEANTCAGGWLLPTPLPTPPERVSAGWVERIAAERELAPIVIVGQLQKANVLEWRSTLAKDAPTVSEALETW